MKNTACVAYVLAKNNCGATKLNAYYGYDLTEDSAICAAFINVDKNHIYFVYPEMASKEKYTHSCRWCRTLTYQEFCSKNCQSLFNSAQKDNPQAPEFVHNRFASFNDLAYV